MVADVMALQVLLVEQFFITIGTVESGCEGKLSKYLSFLSGRALTFAIGGRLLGLISARACFAARLVAHL
jgi:hypothetical protein